MNQNAALQKEWVKQQTRELNMSNQQDKNEEKEYSE